MLGEFALADADDVDAAMKAAHAAFPAWRALPVAERARLIRKVGDLMEERVYDIAAALTLEVGKNRMEALGEAQETVDFFHHYADDFERHAGYRARAAERPARRRGLAQPQRDAAARRVGGDRAVQLPVRARRRPGRGGAGHRQHRGGARPRATRRGRAACSPTASAMPACRRASSTTSPARGREVGEALAQHPLTAGITFTGSVGVGMQLLQQMAGGA